MNVITDEAKIDQTLTRGVAEVIGGEELKRRMLAGERLRIKLGIDPTSPNIHLGRSVALLKLRDFQELGHQVVFIIGGFTAQVGDTSDKDSERPMLSPETVQENYRGYMEQVGKIVDLSSVEIHNNNDWLSPLTFGEVSRMADEFSVNEFISREIIDRRIQAGKRVSLREMLYPLMQGFDSVQIKSDVEIGGTDQRFNCLAGRELQRHFGQQPQSIVIGTLINGTDGDKMSSSKGNVISLTMSPADMFGKIMTVHDDLIIEYFEILTRLPMDEVAGYQKRLNEGENPRDIKMALAHHLVGFYYGFDEAERVQSEYIAQFSEGKLPENIPDFTPNEYDIISVLVDSGLAKSKSDARRVLEQGGVRINQEQISDPETLVIIGDIVSRGKLQYIKIS